MQALIASFIALLSSHLRYPNLSLSCSMPTLLSCPIATLLSCLISALSSCSGSLTLLLFYLVFALLYYPGLTILLLSCLVLSLLSCLKSPTLLLFYLVPTLLYYSLLALLSCFVPALIFYFMPTLLSFIHTLAAKSPLFILVSHLKVPTT